MRGKRLCRLNVSYPIWITPAGAGKTVTHWRQKSKRKDHPRRCGENLQIRTIYYHMTGSPPQVRGKQRIYISSSSGSGITPAGAGKTRLPVCRCKPLRDHPRRCGENSIVFYVQQTLTGSPPQVRGKHIRRENDACTGRITPAGAGKTRFRPPTEARDRDHPRRCGENPYVAGIVTCKAGSPPQVRGKRVR